MIEKQQIAISLLALSMLLLIGCGGGGGEPNNPLAGGNLNSDFKGKLFIGSEEDGPWIMNFSTGRYTPIPGVLWEDNPDYFHSAHFSAYPVAYDGIEFIETIGQCRNNPGLLNYDDCIIIRDSQGGVVSKIDVPYETHGPARLSRDRQYFAVPIEDPIGRLNHEALTLFTRDGSRIDASDEDVHSFDWLPDNRLIYASGQTLYITQPGSAKGSVLVTFPDTAGQPGQLAVSPDGSQLAFTLKTHANFIAIYGTTWVLNLDGSNLRQLTNTPGPNDPDIKTDDPIINFPTWSPDGRWIAVVEGRVVVTGNTGGIAKGGLFIVPSDGDNVMLIDDGTTTSAVLIYSYFEETYDFIDNPELSPRFNVDRGSLAWLP